MLNIGAVGWGGGIMGDLNGVSELIQYKVNTFVISFIGIFIKYCIRGIEMCLGKERRRNGVAQT